MGICCKYFLGLSAYLWPHKNCQFIEYCSFLIAEYITNAGVEPFSLDVIGSLWVLLVMGH